MRLIDIVNKNCNLGESVCSNIFDDLYDNTDTGTYVRSIKELMDAGEYNNGNIIIVAFCFVSIFSSVGMCLQKMIDRSELEQILNDSVTVISRHANNIVVEVASEQAFEFIQSYDKRINAKSLNALMRVAKNINKEISNYWPFKSVYTSSFSYEQAIKEHGFDNFVVAMTLLLPFNIDPFIARDETIQFLREEAQAMIYAGGYAKKFAEKLFDYKNKYINVFDAKPIAYIDYSGGPQQTLLKMTFDYTHEVGKNSLNPVKFRCAVVEWIGIMNKCRITPVITYDDGDKIKIVSNSMISIVMSSFKVDKNAIEYVSKKVAEGDDILGELRMRYYNYFEKFYV